MGEALHPSVLRPTGALSFAAGAGEYEEKTVVLNIENVAEFLATSKSGFYQRGVAFEVGSCALTRVAATWEWYLQSIKDNGEDWVGGYLGFCPSTANVTAKASHIVSLSSGGNLLTSFAMEIKEFSQNCTSWQQKLIRKAELLEKTGETNTLEVTLLLKVFSPQGFTPLQELHATPIPLDLLGMRGEVILALKKILDSGDGADVEVKVPKEVGGEVDESSYIKKAHKAILMARSSVFSKMFDKDSKMIEAKTGKVVISDLSPRGLDIFLRYLYTGEVLADWAQVLPELLNAAEKYDCGKLKQFLGHKFLAAVTPANAFKMYKLAKLHSLSFAVKGVMEFIHKNAKTLITEVAIDKIADTDTETGE